MKSPLCTFSREEWARHEAHKLDKIFEAWKDYLPPWLPEGHPLIEQLTGLNPRQLREAIEFGIGPPCRVVFLHHTFFPSASLLAWVRRSTSVIPHHDFAVEGRDWR